jgi:putative endopeptidase
VTVAEADRATPRFSWSEFLRSQGLAVRGFSLSPTKFFAEVDAMLADVPVSQWKAYLPRARDRRNGARTCPTPSPPSCSISTGGRSAVRSSRSRAGSASCRTMEGQIGEAIGQRYVERWFPPASKAAMEALVTNLRAR